MVTALYFINAPSVIDFRERTTRSLIDGLLTGDVTNKNQWTYYKAKYLFILEN